MREDGERARATTQGGSGAGADVGAPRELTGTQIAALVALVTSVQGLSTFAALALSILAPKAAATFGVGAEMIGYQISIVYVAAAALSSFAGLYVRRLGAATTSVAAVLISAAGLACLASGNVLIALIASLVIGVGYGLTNPSASHLLWRFAPVKQRNLIFALKQTGVPLGGILAALLLPGLSEIAGWQGAILLSTILHVTLASLLWARRSRLDDDRNPTTRVQGALLEALRIVIKDRALRALAIMGFGYASAQLCLLSFVVTMLVEDLGWTLVAAGGMATLMQIGGAAGRIAWSLLAQWLDRGIGVLMSLGIASGACALAVALVTPAWPTALLGGLLFAFGACLVGWNGLYMAEVARASRPETVSLATGGVLVFNFVGIVIGPAAFATLYKLTHSYASTFGIASVLPLIGAAALVPALYHRRRA